MGFMEAQMTQKEWWYAVDGPQGTDFVREADSGHVSVSNGGEL